MATKSKSAHWQAVLRQRRREAGMKAMTVWLPKEGAVRLARYPEKERGEVVTRALALLESQGELTGDDATLTGRLTGEPRGEDEGGAEDTLTVAGFSARLKQVEAILSTLTSNTTSKLTGEDTTLTGYPTRGLTGDEPPGLPATLTGKSTSKLTGEAARESASSGRPCPEIVRGTSITGESTDKPTGEVAVALSETPAGLPPKRVAALIRKAKKLSAKGVSWKAIAQRFNVENVPTLSGIGKWYGSTVKHMVEKQGRGE